MTTHTRTTVGSMQNIMSLYAWWYNSRTQTINFITEVFMSGSLRAYRKHARVMNEHILKRWAWQILEGLVYLHGHSPPIVHRWGDFSCSLKLTLLLNIQKGFCNWRILFLLIHTGGLIAPRWKIAFLPVRLPKEELLSKHYCASEWWPLSWRCTVHCQTIRPSVESVSRVCIIDRLAVLDDK